MSSFDQVLRRKGLMSYGPVVYITLSKSDLKVVSSRCLAFGIDLESSIDTS